MGKALYEGILVDVAFAGFFLAKVGWIAVFKDPSTLTGAHLVRSGSESRVIWTILLHWTATFTRVSSSSNTTLEI